MSTQTQQSHFDAVHKVQDEYAKLESKMLEQARQAIDETARLWHAALSYGEQMSAEWRKMVARG